MTKLAVQLYTLRHYGDIDAILKAVSGAGYSVVETVGMHGVSAQEMIDLLAKYQLEVCSSHVAISELETNLEAQIAFNKAIGNSTLVLPYLAPGERPSSKEAWLELGQRAGAIGQKCLDAGMQFLYHNHDFEMQTVEGQLALDCLLEGAGLDNVGVELDLAWVVKGQHDPLDLLERYRGHVPRVHVKDIAPAGENQDEDGWADVGHGVMSWDNLLPVARDAGAEVFIVEHDNPKDPVRTITRSYQYLVGQQV